MLTTTPQKSHQDCPFCRNNDILKGDVLAISSRAYLIENNYSKGSYLIIPEMHTESIVDLPDDWLRDVKELLPRIPNLSKDYNLAINHGVLAGQSVKHLHLWVIPRVVGKPSSGKGFARLIIEADDASSVGNE
jgi:diadenosine tetraphosphate (Ap4A) HIT family hydrolase